MTPWHLAALYFTLILWARDMDTLSGLAEQIIDDDRLESVSRYSVERALASREAQLREGFNT